MAYESPIETALEALETLFETYMDTYLTGISAAKDDGLVLESFKSIEISDSDPFSRTAYPVLLLSVEDMVNEVVSMGHDEWTTSIAAIIVASEGTPDLMTRKMLRYVEAVREIIRDYPTASNAVDLISVESVNYEPTAPGDVSVKIATVHLKMKQLIAN